MATEVSHDQEQQPDHAEQGHARPETKRKVLPLEKHVEAEQQLSVFEKGGELAGLAPVTRQDGADGGARQCHQWKRFRSYLVELPGKLPEFKGRCHSRPQNLPSKRPSSPNHSKNPLIRDLLELAVEDMGTIYNLRSKSYFGPCSPVGSNVHQFRSVLIGPQSGNLQLRLSGELFG